MSKRSKLDKGQWDSLLSELKSGELTVLEASKKYAISTKTIYNKMSKAGGSDANILKINKLEREVKGLKELIGHITYELKKEKKLF
jgi:hypothetical protein